MTLTEYVRRGGCQDALIDAIMRSGGRDFDFFALGDLAALLNTRMFAERSRHVAEQSSRHAPRDVTGEPRT